MKILIKNTLDKLALGDDVLEGSRNALDILLKIGKKIIKYSVVDRRDGFLSEAWFIADDGSNPEMSGAGIGQQQTMGTCSQ